MPLEVTDFRDEVLRVFGTIRSDIGLLSQRFDGHQQKTLENIGDIRTEIALIKQKQGMMSAIYGLIGGAIPAAFLIVMHFLK